MAISPRSRTTQIILCFLGLSLVSGVAGPYLLPESPYLLGTILTAITAGVWCHEDALQRKHPLSHRMFFGIVLLAAVFMPLYLFRSRGLRGFLPLAGAVLVLIGGIALAEAGAVLAAHLGLFPYLDR